MPICNGCVLKISLDDYTNYVHGKDGVKCPVMPLTCAFLSRKKALQTDSAGDMLTLSCSAGKHRSHGCMWALLPAKLHVFLTNTKIPQRMMLCLSVQLFANA